MLNWISTETKLVVQGLTGREGKYHALACRDYGTQVVAGVTPGKGGTTVEGIPVFDSVEEARQATGANASMVFVPPPFAALLVGKSALQGRPTAYVCRGPRCTAPITDPGELGERLGKPGL